MYLPKMQKILSVITKVKAVRWEIPVDDMGIATESDVLITDTFYQEQYFYQQSWEVNPCPAEYINMLSYLHIFSDS